MEVQDAGIPFDEGPLYPEEENEVRSQLVHARKDQTKEGANKLDFKWLLDGAKKRDEKYLKQMSRKNQSALYRNAETFEAQYVLNKIEVPDIEDDKNAGASDGDGADVKELERMVKELE